MNLDLMIESLPELLSGTLRTVELLILTLIIGLVLAVPLAILRVQRAAMYWLPVHAYITFFRGTPLLVQLFLIYYGLAQFDVIRESWAWPYLRQPFVCALLTFGLHTAAYTANILRGASWRFRPVRSRQDALAACRPPFSTGGSSSRAPSALRCPHTAMR